MKLLVFAHTPPPHHGQSQMTAWFLQGLRDLDGPSRNTTNQESIEIFHVDARLSSDAEDIGHVRPGKLLSLLSYCFQAVWQRHRNDIDAFYYIPAPGKRAAIYRDWIVMACCRPFFPRIIFHWHATGMGEWLKHTATPWERWITRRLLGRSQLSLVLGEFARPDVENLEPGRIEVVPNGIPDPCPDFHKSVLPRRIVRTRVRAHLQAGTPSDQQDLACAGILPEVFRVLFIGLCTREKGLFDTLEAVTILNRKLIEEHSRIRVHLDIAGQFTKLEERKEFDRWAAHPALQTSAPGCDSETLVHYHHFARGPEKARLFRESDCLCFPTYYHAEGFPLVILEAMAFGLPVVTSAWRGIPEVLPPGYPAMVPQRAPQAVAKCLEALIGTYSADQLREHFQRHFLLRSFLEGMRSALVGSGA